MQLTSVHVFGQTFEVEREETLRATLGEGVACILLNTRL